MKSIWFLPLLMASIATGNDGPRTKSKVEPKIKVMVIDSGIGLNYRIDGYVNRSFSYDYVDLFGHGTHIAGLITRGSGLGDPVCKNVEIYSCRYFDRPDGADTLEKSTKCFKKAAELNMDFINYSGGGPTPNHEEKEAVSNFKGIIVAAAGNFGQNLTEEPYYPASYGFNNIKVVQNQCNDGQLCKSSNKIAGAYTEPGEAVFSTKPNNKFGKMSGTSQAAAVFTHKLLQERCKEINHE